MTYIKNKFFKSSNKTDVSGQTISTTYVEIQGSRASIEKSNISSDFYYFFSFSMVTKTEPHDKIFTHVKLQKSNDNFSSNIVDIAGCNYNCSTDTAGSTDHINKANNVFFIVQNTSNDSLRLVARSYSTNNKSVINQTLWFDGAYHSDKYYYPTLTVKEL